MRVALALLVAASGLLGAGRTADLAARLVDAGLDPQTCVRVRDLPLIRGDLRFYFNDGYIIFGQPVEGVRLSAVFIAAEEGGDAELLLLPPTRAERMSLSFYAKTPNLNEHFQETVMVFSDDTAAELQRAIAAAGEPRHAPDRGAEMAERWNPVVRNFARGFQVRLLHDLLGDNRAAFGLFYAAVAGRTAGNFDVMYDPRAAEQITVGRATSRGQQRYFDVWTRFASREFRNGRRTVPSADVTILSYNIEAEIDPAFNMRVITRATVKPGLEGKHSLTFDISPQMRITGATLDGEPVEVLQPESMRSNLIRGSANETFLVVPNKTLQPGREYAIEFRHEGNVVSDAGNGVYFVGARGAWYPNRYCQFSRFELMFRYPADLDLVATGRLDEAIEDGQWRVARYRADVPLRLVGFNLGRYEHHGVLRGDYAVDVYANRTLETALAPRRQAPAVKHRGADPVSPRWTVDLEPVIEGGPRPSARLERLGSEIAGALEFMAGAFGPPVLKQLTVSPIPGNFGQGFPGLIYLSTLAYLDAADRPHALRNDAASIFFDEILTAHETAHQWWGNLITSAETEGDWLMEALANYSALLYLEKRKGAQALDAVLSSYREDLLTKTESGATIESAGPIVWGLRLESSHTPDAWRLITYEKGSWILHMLRRRMGDDRFFNMLGQLRKRYQYKGISTEEFRRLAAEFLPPKSPDPDLEVFFEQFVYSTGVPSLKLEHTVRGSGPAYRVSGTVTQTGVDKEFSAYVPVEIQLAKGKPVVVWVRSSSDPVTFSVTVRQKPVSVALDPGNAVLRR